MTNPDAFWAQTVTDTDQNQSERVVQIGVSHRDFGPEDWAVKRVIQRLMWLCRGYMTTNTPPNA